VGYRRQRAAHGQEVTLPVASAIRSIPLSQRRPALQRLGCGVVFFLGLIAACRTVPPPAPSDATVLRIAVPESIATGSDVGFGQFVSVLSLEGLINVGADGRPVPWLAARWAWEDDYRRLRIYLRREAFLHDGRLIDATLAKTMLEQAIARGKTLYPALNDIEAVRTDGSDELVLDLSRPSPQLPEDLSVPLRAADDKGIVLGTGPYRVKPGEPGELLLEGFERYYLGRPSIAQVQVRPSDTLRTSWARLLRGDVDVVADVPADAAAFIRNDDVQVVSFERWYQFLIAFNSQRGPLRSPLVRRALNLAIDRESVIRKVLQGAGTPATGPIWPQYWAYDASLQPNGFDPTQAEALLDAAGYKRPTAAPRNAPPARLRFTCLIPENFTVWERIALEVQKSLFDIGVDMQFRAVSFNEFNRLLLAGDFDAAINDMISGPTPGRASIFWASARHVRGFNVFGYENTEAERLFELLRRAPNDAATRSATRRLQQVFIEDPPALFLAWNTRARAIRRDVAIPEAGRDPLLTLWQWMPRSASQVASLR
jgi:peptide/nickel transport system substrate-binding protein